MSRELYNSALTGRKVVVRLPGASVHVTKDNGLFQCFQVESPRAVRFKRAPLTRTRTVTWLEGLMGGVNISQRARSTGGHIVQVANAGRDVAGGDQTPLITVYVTSDTRVIVKEAARLTHDDLRVYDKR